MTLPRAAEETERYPEHVRKEMLQDMKQVFWSKGELKYLCRPNAQAKIYERILNQPRQFPGEAEPLICLCHRRMGKTHVSGITLVKRAISDPGSVSLFCADTTENARNNMEGKLQEIFMDMPASFTVRTRKNIYFIRKSSWPRHRESKIILKGVDYNMGGGMRGGDASLVVMDEVREIRYLDYVVERVINPMFLGHSNPTLVMLTTPPESMEHDFVEKYVPIAKERGSLITIPCSSNPDFHTSDRKLMMNKFGDEKSIGWRREMECELIPDTERMVCPEWLDVRETSFVRGFSTPADAVRYVTIDTGWIDFTGVVFSSYDFPNEQLQVVDEIFLQKTLIEVLVELIAEKIKEHFPKNADIRIHADAPALVLAEFNARFAEHGYFASEADKFDKWSNLNALRDRIQRGSVLVHQRCAQLDNQLRNAMFNKKQTDFARSVKSGHADLIAALLYQCRKVCWEENPTVFGPKVRMADKMQPVHDRDNWKGTGTDEETLEAMSALFGQRNVGRGYGRKRGYEHHTEDPEREE